MGWIFDASGREIPPWVALVGPEGRVSGLATFGMQRDDVALPLKTKAARRAGFDGFIQGQGSVSWIYGWFGDDRWCRFHAPG